MRALPKLFAALPIALLLALAGCAAEEDRVLEDTDNPEDAMMEEYNNLSDEEKYADEE